MILPHPLTALAKALRVRQTEAEKCLWMELRNRRLSDAKFRRQYATGHYILDFICLEKKLVIELDGSQHLGQQTYDNERTRYLTKQGFQVLRFWSDEVFLNLDGVLERIREYLEPPSPAEDGDLSRQRER